MVIKDDEFEIRNILPTSPQGEHVRFCHLRLDYFHRPADRQLRPALLALGAPDDLQTPSRVLAHPLVQLKIVILRVAEHPLDLAHRLALQPGEQGRGRRPVVDRRGRYEHGQ